jgi:dihydrofolate synthase/folylpolyglutamate synthase
MPHNSYAEAIEWLFHQFPSYQNLGSAAYKPDLGNIVHLLELLDHPEKNLRFIHVAGTNGKGSTVSLLSSILSESGEKVGLFTSPHIQSFTERIRINGKVIDEDAVVNFCQRIRSLAISPSFFEITFAMALDYFRANNCSICVIETGLGGRLDATNCITPIASIITNISLEHTQLLGDTKEQIAIEKAGIIKPNVPVFIGNSETTIRPIFENITARQSSPITFCHEFKIEHTFHLPLLGEYQQENLNTVLHTINYLNTVDFSIEPSHVQAGLTNLVLNSGFYGRMQHISSEPDLYVDVSHNEEGIRKTLQSLQQQLRGRLFVIYGTSSDKDISSIIPLFDSSIHLCFCSFSNPRSTLVEEWEAISLKHERQPAVYDRIDRALNACLTSAQSDDLILITGSFFLLSDFFHFFKPNSLSN